MAKKSTIDMTALGILLISIFILNFSWTYSTFFKYFGIAGSILLIIVESVFLYERWFRRKK